MAPRFFVCTVLGSLLCLPGCGSDSTCIQGQGPLVSRTIDLASFEGVDFQVAGAVSISQGDEQLVEVRAQENIIELLNTGIRDGVWDIGFSQCVRDIDSMEVDITIPSVSYVELSGSGGIVAEASNDSITTVLSGSGNIGLSGNSAAHEVALSGAGNIDAFELITEQTSTRLSGSGNVRVSASEQLTVVLSGTGDVFYKGNPDLDVTVTGVGDVIDAN